MSQIFNQTIYSFQLQTSNDDGYDLVDWTAMTQNGMSDEWANAIYQALKAVVPPAGCRLDVSVSKQNVIDTVYSTGTDTDPVTFT